MNAAAAQLKIDAIDKRIDAVRAELVRRVGSFEDMSARGWQIAWDSYPGLQGIERSLYRRRGDWQEVRDEAAHKEWKAEQRRANRAARQSYAKPRACEACGQLLAA